MSAADQQALIRRAKEGSVQAFGELVMLHQDRLYRFLLSRSGARADAEDAMQEAFVSAFRYLRSYDARWQFSTWLYRIALRELGKVVARHAGTRTVRESEADTAADPLAACIAADQRKNLWLTARNVLGEQAYTALWLRYAEDMPVRDVARVMGRPATWVKVVVHRARRRLADVLATTSSGAQADKKAGSEVAGGAGQGHALPRGARAVRCTAAIKERP